MKIEKTQKLYNENVWVVLFSIVSKVSSCTCCLISKFILRCVYLFKKIAFINVNISYTKYFGGVL